MNTAHTTSFSTILTILTALCAVVFLVPFVAYGAEAPLSVSFMPNPLFSELQFLPGDSSSGTVDVSNNSDALQSVFVEAVNVNDSELFSTSLHLSITEGESTLYDGSMRDFLTAGPVALSSLAAGDTTSYVFEVSFAGNNNEDQGHTLGFDVCVGFEGGTLQCGETVVSPEEETNGGGGGGGSSGGGGGITGQRLIIDDEHVISMEPDQGTASIGWVTNLLATSQVIYGPASGTYVLDLGTLPYFGYPFGTTEEASKRTTHALPISGLTPGEVYKYRVVSRASPPTISPEYLFVFGGNENPELALVTETSGRVPSVGGDDEGEEEVPVAQPSENEEEDADVSNTQTQTAAAFLALPSGLLGFLDSSSCLLWVALILLAVYVAWLLFDGIKKYAYILSEHERKMRRKIFLIMGVLLMLLIAIVLGFSCVIIPLIAALLLLVLWSLMTPRDEEEDWDF